MNGAEIDKKVKNVVDCTWKSFNQSLMGVIIVGIGAILKKMK